MTADILVNLSGEVSSGCSEQRWKPPGQMFLIVVNVLEEKSVENL